MTETSKSEDDLLFESVRENSGKRLKGVAKVQDQYYVAWNIANGRGDTDKEKDGNDNTGERNEERIQDGSMVEDERGSQKRSRKDSARARKRAKHAERQKKRGVTERPEWESLCFQASMGKVCEKGEECKFKHDVEDYMKNRPPNLNGLCCLAFKESGSCPCGLRCMVGEEHIRKSVSQNGTPTWELIEEAPPSDMPSGYNRLGECNFLTPEKRKSLRHKEYYGVVVDGLSKRKKPDFRNKIYIAPLTTVGNLPFRRIVKEFGADVTCGEMAIAKCLVEGQTSEWSLVRRHRSEDVFGVQLAGNDAGTLSKAVQLLERECEVDFVDINLGCPIDLICNQGAGSALLRRVGKLEDIVDRVTKDTKGRVPIGLKVRTGWSTSKPTTHTLAARIQCWKHTMKHGDAICYLSVHGRSRTQRYTNYADWDYVQRCAGRVVAAEHLFRVYHPNATKPRPIPVFGNGDILSYLDWEAAMSRQDNWKERISEIEEQCEVEESKLAEYLKGFKESESKTEYNDEADLFEDLDKYQAELTTCMIGRGALIKPWLCTEIKEKRHWDISGSERFDILKKFAEYGLEHWGSDTIGVERTRRFLLEWLSFTCRYVPVGVLDPLYVPQHMNDRPPCFLGRDDRETLLGSNNAKDWIRITEMFLGNVPDGFQFEPKHKSNSYARSVAELLNLPTVDSFA